jgi:hypothetical protein
MKNIKEIIEDLSRPYATETVMAKNDSIIEFIEQNLSNKVNELPKNDTPLISLYKRLGLWHK